MIDRLRMQHDLPDAQLRTLLESQDASLAEELFAAAREVRDSHVGHTVRLRGLVEITNCCRNDCLYCGIRASNTGLHRYTLSACDVLSACEKAYAKGIRTFVLQGGENPSLAPYQASIVAQLHQRWPDAVITLSLGELPFESYAAFRKAGAQRYLLRHESATAEHYARLHPAGKTLASRLACARELRRLGFETGLGMMVGSPFQTTDHLIADLRLLQSFRPEMVGCGPFIPHPATPFAAFPAGSAGTTLRLYAIIRLMLPDANIPSTTALRVLLGRQGAVAEAVRGALALSPFPGLEAGANVLMPNFSPRFARADYDLYEGKTAQDSGVDTMITQLKQAGYRYV